MKVVIAGSGSALGDAVEAALKARGHEVVPVDITVCDLTDAEATRSYAEGLGPVDGLLHLVGGWRGGKGLAGQTDEDWEFLERMLIGTLRNTTRAFLPAISASPAGRVAIVSTTGTDKPVASNANYLTAKAAAEMWLKCVEQGLKDTPAQVHVERVMALVSQKDRDANPDKDYSRFTDVTVVAQHLAELFPDESAAAGAAGAGDSAATGAGAAK